MGTLEDLLTDAITSTNTDGELARAIVDSGALQEIIKRGTYSQEAVQQKLTMTAGTLRATVSKAQRGKSSFPTPAIDGRRWSRQPIDSYLKKRSKTGANTSTTTNASIDSDEPNGSRGSMGSNSSIAPNSRVASGRTDVTSGTVASGSGDVGSASEHHLNPDQRSTGI